jgi:hypothetical protein
LSCNGGHLRCPIHTTNETIVNNRMVIMCMHGVGSFKSQLSTNKHIKSGCYKSQIIDLYEFVGISCTHNRLGKYESIV